MSSVNQPPREVPPANTAAAGVNDNASQRQDQDTPGPTTRAARASAARSAPPATGDNFEANNTSNAPPRSTQGAAVDDPPPPSNDAQITPQALGALDAFLYNNRALFAEFEADLELFLRSGAMDIDAIMNNGGLLRAALILNATAADMDPQAIRSLLDIGQDMRDMMITMAEKALLSAKQLKEAAQAFEAAVPFADATSKESISLYIIMAALSIAAIALIVTGIGAPVGIALLAIVAVVGLAQAGAILWLNLKTLEAKEASARAKSAELHIERIDLSNTQHQEYLKNIVESFKEVVDAMLQLYEGYYGTIRTSIGNLSH